jgi:hypothetical protein
MFGFGMSAVDKAILRDTEKMLAAYSLGGIDVKSLSRRIFDETKSELLNDNRGNAQNLYIENIGDRLIQSKKYFAPRQKAGLTEIDIQRFYNRPSLAVSIVVKINNMTKFILIDIARQNGNDLVQFARDNRRRSPIYGEPDLWDQTLPVNAIFSPEDADLYIEFMYRVGVWRERTPTAEQDGLVAQHTSFNAMIRNLVRQGKV